MLVNPKWAFQTPTSLTLDGNIKINSTDRSVGDRASFYVQSTKSNPVPVSRKENWVFFPIPLGSWLPVLQGWDLGPNADMIQAGMGASGKFLKSKTIAHPICGDSAKALLAPRGILNRPGNLTHSQGLTFFRYKDCFSQSKKVLRLRRCLQPRAAL